jgi:hypothetical protein
LLLLAFHVAEQSVEHRRGEATLDFLRMITPLDEQQEVREMMFDPEA